MRHIGDRLKEVMRMRGINATTMAKDLNLGKGHISNIMTGRIQTPKKHLPTIATYLKVSQAWLLTGEGMPEHREDVFLPVYKIVSGDQQLIGECKLTGIELDKHHFGLVSVSSFPEKTLIVIAPEKQGDGFYLVENETGPMLAQRIDQLTHIEWVYLSKTPPQQPIETSVLGKIEAIFDKEVYHYEVS